MKNEKEVRPAQREINLAKEEFFKDKPEPKTDEEMEKQFKEFIYWYNFVRKQSDTGKTPAEMYREIYNREPPNVNEIIDFEDDSEEFDGYSEELVRMSSEIFDEEIWIKFKKESKNMSKKEIARTMFGLGFVMHNKILNEEIEDFEEKMKKDPKFAEEIINEFIKKAKNATEKRSED